MGNLYSQLFGPIIEEDGRRLPFSRLDIFWAVVLAFALMVAASFATVLFSPHEHFGYIERRNFTIAVIVVGVVLLLNGRRKLLLGAALFIMSVRLLFGVVAFNGHRLEFGVLLIICASGSYLCLRNIE